ncbi:unnamed protein product [Lactuca virosa]|uniref:Uncharacterized protein n=1 Tax=Lactuca virosa TaxID=75947 RepID=A0AAU9N4Z2_9ASTR|nr:unnamed protein product [Lactuca virosa]
MISTTKQQHLTSYLHHLLPPPLSLFNIGASGRTRLKALPFRFSAALCFADAPPPTTSWPFPTIFFPSTLSFFGDNIGIHTCVLTPTTNKPSPPTTAFSA